jgi:GAF domain
MDESEAPGVGAGPGAARANREVRRLCEECVAAAGVDGCVVSVLSGGGTPLTMHATDPLAATIEDLQFTLGQGPCLDATSSGVPVLISDLRDPGEGVFGRWPMFLEDADRAGVRAVFAFPVRIGAIGLGVMDLYRRLPGPLSRAQMASTFTTVEALGRQMLDPDNAPPDDPAATYPLTVHQAAGMVMVQTDSSIDEALVRLRATAYRDGRPVGTLADDVVAGRYTFGTEEQ